MRIGLLGPLALLVTLFGTGPAFASDVNCVCPFYFYGGGPGSYYCYAFHHFPDCPTKNVVSDVVGELLYGACNNGVCSNCQDATEGDSAKAGALSEEPCCGGETATVFQEPVSVKESQKTVIEQDGRDEAQEANGRLSYPFPKEALPVAADFGFERYHPGPKEILYENLNVEPFGDPLILKHCSAPGCEDEKYLMLLLYKHTNEKFPQMERRPVSMMVGFAFELKPSEEQKKKAKWLAPNMIRKAEGAEEAADQVFINWGVASIIGFVKDNTSWAP